MPGYVALLRAVNLGPHQRIVMADLRAIGEKCGWSKVRTVVQTGNLLFETKQQRVSALEQQLEAALAKAFGLSTPVLVRSAKDWRAALEANPFPRQAKSDPSHLVIMVLKAKCSAGALETLRAAIVGRERVELVGQQLYAVYPDNIGESKLTSALIERKLGVTGTARNWNTARKVLDAFDV